MAPLLASAPLFSFKCCSGFGAVESDVTTKLSFRHGNRKKEAFLDFGGMIFSTSLLYCLESEPLIVSAGTRATSSPSRVVFCFEGDSFFERSIDEEPFVEIEDMVVQGLTSLATVLRPDLRDVRCT